MLTWQPFGLYQVGEVNVQQRLGSEDHLVCLVRGMSLEPDDLDLVPVLDTMQRIALTADKLSSCIQVVLQRCYNDWRFCKTGIHCLAACCHHEALSTVDGVSCRTTVLKSIQALYQRELTFYVKLFYVLFQL